MALSGIFTRLLTYKSTNSSLLFSGDIQVSRAYTATLIPITISRVEVQQYGLYREKVM